MGMRLFKQNPTDAVVHHSGSPYGSVPIFDRWHVKRGMSMIGYHTVIGNGVTEQGGTYNPMYDGAIWLGRDLKYVGAHCKAGGMNFKSIGICLVGNGVFTEAQKRSLVKVLKDLDDYYNTSLNLSGHGEHDPKKIHCPGFNVNSTVLEWSEAIDAEEKKKKGLLIDNGIAQMFKSPLDYTEREKFQLFQNEQRGY